MSENDDRSRTRRRIRTLADASPQAKNCRVGKKKRRRRKKILRWEVAAPQAKKFRRRKSRRRRKNGDVGNRVAKNCSVVSSGTGEKITLIPVPQEKKN